MAAAYGHRLEPMDVDEGDANDARDEQQTCRVCFDKPRQCALRPCGHVTLCEACLARVMRVNRQCPVCRQRIDGYCRVYL